MWGAEKNKLLEGVAGTLAADGSTQGDGTLMRNFFFETEPCATPVHIAKVTTAEKSAVALNQSFDQIKARLSACRATCLAVTVDNAPAELLGHLNLRAAVRASTATTLAGGRGLLSYRINRIPVVNEVATAAHGSSAQRVCEFSEARPSIGNRKSAQ